MNLHTYNHIITSRSNVQEYAYDIPKDSLTVSSNNFTQLLYFFFHLRQHTMLSLSGELSSVQTNNLKLNTSYALTTHNK